MTKEEEDVSLPCALHSFTPLACFTLLSCSSISPFVVRGSRTCLTSPPQLLPPSPVRRWLRGRSRVSRAVRAPISISPTGADGQAGFSNKDSLKPLKSGESKMKPPAALLSLGKQQHQQTNRKAH